MGALSSKYKSGFAEDLVVGDKLELAGQKWGWAAGEGWMRHGNPHREGHWHRRERRGLFKMLEENRGA